jgi:Membrane-associated phospholipid phosphatase
LKRVWGKWSYLLFVWAGTISYAQVYVGVHYPLDIMCGALMGCLIGYITATVYVKKIGMPDPVYKNTANKKE